jgi:phosphoribosylformylglycinamidine cyclo-ligase
MTYADAGVEVCAAEENVRRIAGHVRSTHGPAVLGSFGAFAGLFQFPDLRDPVLVASADNIGTKLQLALQFGRYESMGRDLVNLNVNDVLTTGARPLFFLDYIAVHKLEHDVVEQLVSGMAAACRENGCALLGGETAQLPDLYAPGHYDLAGFVVGAVERDRLIDGSAVRPGDRVWALPSTGLHTNGYTLARRIVAQARLDLGADPGGLGQPLGDALLAPHVSYMPVLQPLLDRGGVKAVAHITGGGLPGNLPRVLPSSVSAEMEWGSWPVPPIFRVLQETGRVRFAEMLRVFNLGIGLVLVLDADLDPSAMCPAALPVGRITEAQSQRVVLRNMPA